MCFREELGMCFNNNTEMGQSKGVGVTLLGSPHMCDYYYRIRIKTKKKKRYTWRKNSDRIYLHRVRGKGELKDKEKEVIGLLLLDDICLTLDSYPCLRTFRSIRVESGKLQLLPSICLWVLPTESASHCSSYFFISNMLLKFIEIKIQGIW